MTCPSPFTHPLQRTGQCRVIAERWSGTGFVSAMKADVAEPPRGSDVKKKPPPAEHELDTRRLSSFPGSEPINRAGWGCWAQSIFREHHQRWHAEQPDGVRTADCY